MRINNFFALGDIIFMSKTMPAMLKELSAKKDSGLLWYRQHLSPPYLSVQQYWESFDKLVTYAHDKDGLHFPMWAAFNKRIMKSKNIGIWHETYLVEPGKFECVYGNMPLFVSPPRPRMCLRKVASCMRRTGSRLIQRYDILERLVEAEGWFGEPACAAFGHIEMVFEAYAEFAWNHNHRLVGKAHTGF